MMEPRSCVSCFAQPNFKLSQDHQEDGEAEAAAGGAAQITAGLRRARMERTRLSRWKEQFHRFSLVRCSRSSWRVITRFLPTYRVKCESVS